MAVATVTAMELSAGTIGTYLRHALDGMAAALDRFDDETVNVRPHGEHTNSAAILIVHACASATFWFDAVGLGHHVDRDRDAEFEATATVDELRALLAAATERLPELAAALDAGPSATDHELRSTLHDGDDSDGSIVLHALEELYQHLGHLELTADALGSPAA